MNSGARSQTAREGKVAGRARRVARLMRAVPLTTVATGLGSGLFFTSASLLSAWVVVRLASGPDLGARAMTIIAMATVAGGCAGSWWAQPVIPRLLAVINDAIRNAPRQQRELFPLGSAPPGEAGPDDRADRGHQR